MAIRQPDGRKKITRTVLEPVAKRLGLSHVAIQEPGRRMTKPNLTQTIRKPGNN